ncbi:hypothetical protein QJ043_04230 [Olsenella sp. YH-ols2217]|uniref:Uncharacterized protein n=1 Tax=Kribbibacterium absianum TaxID=3044210 RepID=A0ABT6ZJR6_9ACTN|nr:MULTISPECIES: hypothetical protein [unclassified Olsenella]MDJ1122460.1 hypothetical protein [Olsenella sp. YH-ols2216]MDJ1129286.1 hypothetical protein [Olsenella sp. YH-ols2217]
MEWPSERRDQIILALDIIFPILILFTWGWVYNVVLIAWIIFLIWLCATTPSGYGRTWYIVITVIAIVLAVFQFCLPDSWMPLGDPWWIWW